MIRREMEDELERLAKGFDVTLLKPKVEAYWKKFCYWQVADLKQAVDDALLDPRFPTGKGLLELLDRAQRDRRRTESLARDRDAKKFFFGERSAPTPLGNFYAKAIARIMRTAPFGEYAVQMADALARWCAADPIARDKYLPEAVYWANMVALSVIDRRAAILKELHYDCGDGYSPPGGRDSVAEPERSVADSYHYACSRSACVGTTNGCKLAPQGCANDAGWRPPTGMSLEEGRRMALGKEKAEEFTY